MRRIHWWGLLGYFWLQSNLFVKNAQKICFLWTQHKQTLRKIFIILNLLLHQEQACLEGTLLFQVFYEGQICTLPFCNVNFLLFPGSLKTYLLVAVRQIQAYSLLFNHWIIYFITNKRFDTLVHNWSLFLQSLNKREFHFFFIKTKWRVFSQNCDWWLPLVSAAYQY